MITFGWYLLKVLLCSGILCGYYFLALRNKVFHRWNRFYLLFTVVLSLLIPFIKIPIFTGGHDDGTVIKVLQAVSVGDNVVINAGQSKGFQMSPESILFLMYALISLFFIASLIYTLLKIYRIRKASRGIEVEGINFIDSDAKGTPFSFFNSIFWNRSIDINSTEGQQIFQHEIAHIKEKHTYDKIFLTVVMLFFWLNPFFWLIRKELNMIHEFIADKMALEDNDINAFSAMILASVYPNQNFSITNYFFYSPIKRRLQMLAKNKNPKVSYVSRLLALPLAAIIFFAFTLKVNSEKSIPIYNGKTINVIIDAGHGGYDVGAKGGNIYEKDLSLAIAKKIKELNSNKNINIILSRDNDEFISVKDRAKLATEKKADLFISIHLDAEQDQNKNNGMTILIPGNDYKYLNQSKLLASSIYESFKNNYALKVASDLMQRQRGLVVLNENTCPAILIEAGFITTQKDLAYLTQSANQEKIALNILNGIENYAQQESSVTINNLQTQDTIPAIYYNNKKLSAVKYLDPSNNIQATYADGSKETMTKEEALKRGFIPPPPPPGLPPYYFKTNMLFVVNGKISTRDIAKNIKPKEITDIYILNEEKGIGKYGDKGKNGVIELTTKHDDDHIHLEADSIFIRTNNADKTSSDWLVNNNSILESSNNSPEPLIIFDGKEISKDEMKNISPNSIQSLDVLKNESAKIYGEKGRNGVFIITSRDFHDQSLKDTIPDKIFQKVEVEASFPGGPNAWRDYIIKKIQAAIDTFTNKDYGTCVVRFVVRTDGSVSNVEATTMKGTLLAKIAMDAIKNGPKWIPASQQGKKVNAYRLQPVTLTNPEKPKKIESSTSQNSKSNAVISKPDQFAQFPGGSSSWLAYITRVLQKNSNNLIAKNSNGTCKIKFLVKKDGSISNVEAINMQHTELAQVAMNAIKQGPKWIPAKLNNNTVDSYLIQPVSFIVKDNLLNKEPN